jgi:hypothetical protein
MATIDGMERLYHLFYIAGLADLTITGGGKTWYKRKANTGMFLAE